jgi:hypothetical protein
VGLDDLEFEASLLRLVLDQGYCLVVAFAHDVQVVDAENVVVALEARVVGWRLGLHAGDLVGALVVAAHREAEAVVVGALD